MQTQALTLDLKQFLQAHEGKTLAKDQQAFQMAVKILDVWAFTDREKSVVLGDIPITTFRRMKAGKMSNQLNVDRRTRLSLILGIHKSLRIMFLQTKHQLEWISNPNRAFGQYSPKDVMLSGALVGLHDIRRYLHAART
ncbi:MAG: DUF2384 domain-containing protein [Idiomarina sp.]|nr:DUF2384 domain-containing protein [Idiomarina sp.]